MIRINLLPHRELKRAAQRQQFYVTLVLMIVLGAGIGFAGHTYLSGNVSQQEARNAFLRSEIAALDREIAEIRTLREQIDALRSRKQVIESLQGNRAETVHLFNELVHRMPEGVRLNSLRQSGNVVTLVGYAQSNARVSHLMRNLDASPYLGQARLIEVRSAVLNNRRVSEFTLNVRIQRPTEDGESRQ